VKGKGVRASWLLNVGALIWTVIIQYLPPKKSGKKFKNKKRERKGKKKCQIRGLDRGPSLCLFFWAIQSSLPFQKIGKGPIINVFVVCPA